MHSIQVEAESSLLVLPPLPSPIKRSSLWAAYKSTFETVLTKLARPGQKSVARLEVGLTLPKTRTYSSRTATYPEDHLFFQEIYTLICLAAAHTNTELDFPGGIDARVFLLFNPRRDGTGSRTEVDWLSGPILNLKTLVTSNRRYKTIFGVDGEEGESVLQSLIVEYRNQRRDTPPIHRLPSGPSLNLASSTSSGAKQQAVKVHHNVIVGGTFDHLHLGHKLLLTATVYMSDPFTTETSNFSEVGGAYASTREITIGMTGDELLVNKKHPQHLESWKARQQRTHDFISSILVFSPPSATRAVIPASSGTESTSESKSESITLAIETTYIDEPGPNGKIVRVTYTLTDPNQGLYQAKQRPPNQVLVINYTQISDPYGPTITEPNISAIIISAETRAGGQAVNEKRAEKNWHTLETFEVGVLDADVSNYNNDEIEEEKSTKGTKGFEGKISSTDIRRRLVDLERTGNDEVTGLEEKQGGKL